MSDRIEAAIELLVEYYDVDPVDLGEWLEDNDRTLTKMEARVWKNDHTLPYLSMQGTTRETIHHLPLREG